MKKFIIILILLSCSACNPQPAGKRVKHSLKTVITYGPCTDPADAVASAEKANKENTLPDYKAEVIDCE